MFSIFPGSEAKSASSALLEESFISGSRQGSVHWQQSKLHPLLQVELQLKIVLFKNTINVRNRKKVKINEAKMVFP